MLPCAADAAYGKAQHYHHRLQEDLRMRKFHFYGLEKCKTVYVTGDVHLECIQIIEDGKPVRGASMYTANYVIPRKRLWRWLLYHHFMRTCLT